MEDLDDGWTETRSEGTSTVIGNGRLLLVAMEGRLVLGGQAGAGSRPSVTIEDQDVLPLIEALMLRQGELSEQARAAAWRSQMLLNPDQCYGALKCESCGARMAFAKTKRGASMPVDLDAQGRPVAPHFVTCPQGKAWSAKGKRKP